MPRILGDYGRFESVVAIIVFVLLASLNFVFFRGISNGSAVTEQTRFLIYFVDLIGLAIIFLPVIIKKSKNISNDRVKRFLQLPDERSEITFPVISGFLSDQALASFLMTVLIFTGKQAFVLYGPVAAIYVAIIYILAVVVGVASLIRFVAHFAKFHWLVYAVGSVVSLAILFAFFNVGMAMAG